MLLCYYSTGIFENINNYRIGLSSNLLNFFSFQKKRS
jgi:hypothetical protein